MGLPEIVDFARNFAVMVRVQGPDPKGLKMRNHAFHLYNSGKTMLSASGILLPAAFNQVKLRDDTQWALVVTVASILEPFLSLQHRENMSQDKPELIPGVQIDIMVKGKVDPKRSVELVPHWLSAQLLAVVDVPEASSAVQSLVQASPGSPEHGWEVGWSLASSSDGPKPLADSLAHVEQSDMQRQKYLIGGQSSNPNLMGRSVAKFALLGICSTISEDLPNLNISPSNKRGDVLLAMGSPFGVLSPMHFFNSISVGSVANCYPSGSSKRSLLMADIRCLPGMEGGPVFGEHGLLTGVLTRPLRQRISGAEIQLVIPWGTIAAACSDLLQEPRIAIEMIDNNYGNLNAIGRLSLSTNLDFNGSSNHLHEYPNSAFLYPSPVEKAMASICLITIDNGAWASGVLLNNKGLILTNAHLLEPWRFRKETANGERNASPSEFSLSPTNDSFPSVHEGIGGGDHKFQGLLPRRLETADSSVVNDSRGNKFSWSSTHRSLHVRLDQTDPWIWCDARVVFVSKGPLDVALLQLDVVPDQLCPIVMDFTCPTPGSKVFVIGHGLFGPRCDFSPSACVGVVAKVVEAKRTPHYGKQDNALGHFPAMLETTAAVHPGGSGGAVVNPDGRIIGLVTSNARHGGGTVIPHLNFSIPCAALEPIFNFAQDMKDLSLLEGLDKPNEHLSSVWALMPPLTPKPGPPLQYLPLPLPGDINQDGKGSRFAKFIAERQDVLRKSSQLGKMEKLSSKL